MKYLTCYLASIAVLAAIPGIATAVEPIEQMKPTAPVSGMDLEFDPWTGAAKGGAPGTITKSDKPLVLREKPQTVVDPHKPAIVVDPDKPGGIGSDYVASLKDGDPEKPTSVTDLLLPSVPTADPQPDQGYRSQWN